MTPKNKIDFEPGLFDDKPSDSPAAQPLADELGINDYLDDEIPEVQSASQRQSRSLFPRIVVGLLFVLLIVCGITAAFMMRGKKEKESPLVLNAVRSEQKEQQVPFLLPSPADRWCDGTEAICTTAISSRPVETLKKVIAAMPKNGAKRYKIRLAVVPVEEPDTDGTSEFRKSSN